MTICSSCGYKKEKGWTYCPKCGSMQRDDFFNSMFASVGKRMKEMESETSKLDKVFEVRDISPFFRKPKSAGFSIKIVRSTGKEPQVSVKTFGNVDKENVTRQIEEQLKTGNQLKINLRRSSRQESHLPIPEKTEEPKINIRRLDNKVVVDVGLPDVSSLDDIHIQELESSVEVKAVAKKKAYFKILTKPPNTRLINREFSHGVLSLEFS